MKGRLENIPSVHDCQLKRLFSNFLSEKLQPKLAVRNHDLRLAYLKAKPHKNTAFGIFDKIAAMNQDCGAVWNSVKLPYLLVLERRAKLPSVRLDGVGSGRDTAIARGIVVPMVFKCVDIEA